MLGLKFISLPPGGGFGNAACEYIAALGERGVSVRWEPVGIDRGSREDRERVLKNAPAELQMMLGDALASRCDYEGVAVHLPLTHGYDSILESEKSKRLWLSVTWELEHLPQHWVAQINRFDSVMVPSQFNADSFAASGVKVPINVVPHIARRVTSQGDVYSHTEISSATAVFYTIGSWTRRKAMEQSIRAYLEAFNSNDDVVLVVKTDAYDYEQSSASESASAQRASDVALAVAKLVARYPSPAKIHLHTHRMSPSEIDSLHRRGDCFLSLTHSEGWGLGAFDALLFGNPVVMPLWSGQLDYLGEDYPLAARHDLMDADLDAGDGVFAAIKNTPWAVADVVHAAQQLRAVRGNIDAMRNRIEPLQHRIQRDFSAQVVAQKLLRCLEISQ
ncbi:MAG: glycosyltransferase [Pseudomonadota bacterium]